MGTNKIKEVLPYILGIAVVILATFQVYHYNQFMSKGPRFTAYDGQELCERLRALERRVGTTINIPCEYLKENGNEH